MRFNEAYCASAFIAKFISPMLSGSVRTGILPCAPREANVSYNTGTQESVGKFVYGLPLVFTIWPSTEKVCHPLP